MAQRLRLGHVILALGFIGLIRLLPEVFHMSRGGCFYAVIVTGDAILAVMTGAAGEGLVKGKEWAPRLALRSAGVLLSTSIGMGLLMGPAVLNPFGQVHIGIASRLLYYGIAVVFWPYAVRALIVAAPEETRKSLILTFLAWFIVGAILVAPFFIGIR